MTDREFIQATIECLLTRCKVGFECRVDNAMFHTACHRGPHNWTPLYERESEMFGPRTDVLVERISRLEKLLKVI